MAAIRAAIACGADYVEIDLRTTKDGHLVLLHDGSVDRMTGSKGALNTFAYREVSRMKLHPVDKTDTATYRIPNFSSVLKLCHGRIHIYLDFKDADVPKTYRLIRAAGMERQIVVYLNKPGQYESWRKVAPRMPLMASIPEKATRAAIDSFLAHQTIQVVDNAYDTGGVRMLHEKGIAVWLDAEGDQEGPLLWDKALSYKPDGLQTNHPEKLIAYLHRLHLR